MDEERPKVSDIEEPPVREKMPPQPSDYVYVIDRESRATPQPKGLAGSSPRPGGKTPAVFLIALIALGVVASVNTLSLVILRSELSATREALKEAALKGQLEVILDEVELIRADVKRLSEELSGLRKDLRAYATKADLARELKDIIGRIEKLQRNINELKENIQGLEQKIKGLTNDLAWLSQRAILLGYLNSITLTVLPKNASGGLYLVRVYLPGRPEQLSDETLKVQIRLLNGTDGRDIGEEPYAINAMPEAGVFDRLVTLLMKGVYLLEIKVNYGPHELVRYQFFSID